MTRRGLCLIVCLAVAVALLGGCAAVSLRNGFQPPGKIVAEPVTDQILILKATENRPLGGRSKIGIGLLILVPFVPYAHQQFTPERLYANAFLQRHDFLQDVSDVVAKDLTASGISTLVSQADWKDTFTFQNPTGRNYLVDLSLDEGIWHRNITLYAISIPAAYLWILGAPVSYGSAELAFTARVKNASSGAVLGEKRFSTKARLTEWIWYPGPVKFSRRLVEGYGKISPELRAFVKDTVEKPAVAAK